MTTHITAPDLDQRLPACHLNYKGNVAAAAMERHAMGPNTLGELLYPVEATYDEATNTTTVGLSYIGPRSAA